MNFAICRMDGGTFLGMLDKFLWVLLLWKCPSVRKINEDTRSTKFSGNSNEAEFLGFKPR